MVVEPTTRPPLLSFLLAHALFGGSGRWIIDAGGSTANAATDFLGICSFVLIGCMLFVKGWQKTRPQAFHAGCPQTVSRYPPAALSEARTQRSRVSWWLRLRQSKNGCREKHVNSQSPPLW